MKVPFFKKKLIKFIANIFLISMAYQLVFPVATYALTSGPSQPEMQSFEPVGTTDMVNMFTGDFNYNIPLLDVEGYPVNIYYHAGPTVEQEASWVGLGWNINPGNINHIVRGFSDDYDGDIIEKQLKVEEESNKYFNIFFGAEAAGVPLDKIFGTAAKAIKNSKITAGGQLNFGMNFNSYSGVSASIGTSGSGGVSTRAANTEKAPWISTGVSMGATVSTDKGVDIDYSFSGGSSMSKVVNADVNGNAGVGVSAGGGMNSREGMKYTFWGVNASLGVNASNIYKSVSRGINKTYIPTGLQNYVPVITNATKMSSLFFQLKVGGELWSIYPFAGGGYGENVVKVEENGDKKAYGYFNLGNASGNDILDFSREKDGNVNRKTAFLPMSNLTYDIYSVNGQGTGGNFRPYRNDVGTIHDPELGSYSSDDSHLAEAGLGNIFEAGYDYKTATTHANSGPWKLHNRKYTNKSKGSTYEPFYIKQGGELTPRNETYNTGILDKQVLPFQLAQHVGNNLQPSNNEKRVTRSNLLYFLSAEEAARRHVSLLPQIENYTFEGFKEKGNWRPYNASTNTNGYKLLNRVDADPNAQRKSHHASEFTQVLPDGQRYIYGLPVMNLYQYDFEVAVAGSTNADEFHSEHYNISDIDYADGMPASPATIPEFSSRTKMPAYAHSYMLTAVLSPDYVDITGNGLTEDDLGSYTKFNYRKYDGNYKWRIPYQKETAQRNRGMRADCEDDRATFSGGEREQWLLHSIESRNFVAEFYTSPRKDGLGADATEGAIFDDANSSYSYKLDSIVLFNKWDRYENEDEAEPLQTTVFYYDYSLCKEITNQAPGGDYGKLTLKSIFIKKGRSKIGYLSPYQFKYSTANEDYHLAAKDCWGNYKSPTGNNIPVDENINLNNFEYPYVNQNDGNVDANSGMWSLEEITLPSGGKIKVTYEADDYAYVQDKKAMEMFRVEGVGPGKKFSANNTLYQSAQNPYLYVYFKRKSAKEHGSDIAGSYLDGENIVQFNFDVMISPGKTASCGNTPLSEMVKGYAKVVESGICDNSDYGYLKLEPKTANIAPQLSVLGIPGAKLNPISLAAINMARYRSPKLLNPEMDIPNGTGKALINAFKSSLGEFANFFQNPLKKYLEKGKAKSFTIGKSYIRLVSQGLTKKGGGHRVKRLEFSDSWAGSSEEFKYGSEYDYTVPLPGTNKKMSSGVASYEPMFGGDENPCRTLMYANEFGNSSKFPASDPIELQHEFPLGESLYPPASVGYSKITVTSIHKDVGESSQTIQEFEHYTAKDFPIKATNATPVQILEDRKPKFFDIFDKQEIYRVAQGYSLELNDMHGKLKQTTTYVRKYDPNNLGNNPDSKELVAYTKYNYFQQDANTLKNDNIPCLEFDSKGLPPKLVLKTLGEDVEITLDSRQKEEKTNFKDFHFSTNGFLAPPLPIIIPIGFPKFKKHSKTFSSFVNTKVIQKYGVMQSVHTFNKGALTVAENIAFDPNTGHPLITSINTEYGDKEYSIKYPAYWAYRNMGMAYENILFEEELPEFDELNDAGSRIRDDVAYLLVNNPDKYNIGDEIELTLDEVCDNTSINGKRYKLWVVDKGNIPVTNYSCVTPTSQCSGSDIMYDGDIKENTVAQNVTYSAKACINKSQLEALIADVTNESEIFDLTDATIGRCSVLYWYYGPINPKYTHNEYYSGCTLPLSSSTSYNGLFAQAANAGAPVGLLSGYSNPPTNLHTIFDYKAKTTPSYSGPIPHQARYKTNISLNVTYRTQKKVTSTGPFDFIHYNNPDPNNNPDGLLAHIHLEIWTNNPPNTGTNPCAYLNTFPQKFESYIVDQTPGAANNTACPSEFLQLRAGVYSYVREYVTTDMWPEKKYLIAKAIKKDALPTDLTASSSFPENEDIIKASVKVVRSGKRNMLSEVVQDVVTTSYPYLNNPSSPGHNRLLTGFVNMVQSSGKTYTDISQVPEGINSDYHNPFVTGERGNYRVNATYIPKSKRLYPDGGNNNQSDRYKGLYGGVLLWGFGNLPSGYNSEHFSKMYIPPGQTDWKRQKTYEYSTWGTPVTIVDALFHRNSVLYDFDNKVPAATVTNLDQNGAIYESFEDAGELYKYDNNPLRDFLNPLKYYPNPLKQWLRTQVEPNTSPCCGELLTDVSHSGKNSLKFTQNTDITLSLTPFLYGPNRLYPFFVHTNPAKYVVSCWQKTGTNGSAPPSSAGIEIKWGTSITEKAVLKPKTPSIDGWVLYEAVFSIPATYTSATISATANTIIDDFRLLPSTSNMKAFVYDPLYRRIAATLDENHMTTFFEYDAQGKLVRVKKETEKGILTLKESRESLKELISSFTY